MTTFRSFWKGEPWSEQRRREKREQLVARAACRALVAARAKGRCERCGGRARDDVPEWHAERAHMNHKVPLSRGGADTPENCEWICQACHLPPSGHAPTKDRGR